MAGHWQDELWYSCASFPFRAAGVPVICGVVCLAGGVLRLGLGGPDGSHREEHCRLSIGVPGPGAPPKSEGFCGPAVSPY